jgi:bifunctional non-homologous end joining protein LigD
VFASLQFIPPCCPVPAKAVPVGDGWQHEVKFDGYRVQVHKSGKDVVIYSRKGHVFTPRFEAIAYMLRELPAQSAVIDGEIVASDRRGVPNFARLHLRSGRPMGSTSGASTCWL